MAWVFKLVRSVLWVFIRVFCRFEVEGRENLPPPDRRCIVVCNHSSYFDPVLLAITIRPVICFLGKAELFRRGFGWIFRSLLAVPVERGTGDVKGLTVYAEQIGKGRYLGIFPEGTRFRDGVAGRPKSGMALIARMTGADILPCGIEYEGRPRVGGRMTLRIGEVIPFEALGLDDESPRGLKRATRVVWDEVLRLKGEVKA